MACTSKGENYFFPPHAFLSSHRVLLNCVGVAESHARALQAYYCTQTDSEMLSEHNTANTVQFLPQLYSAYSFGGWFCAALLAVKMVGWVIRDSLWPTQGGRNLVKKWKCPYRWHKSRHTEPGKLPTPALRHQTCQKWQVSDCEGKNRKGQVCVLILCSGKTLPRVGGLQNAVLKWNAIEWFSTFWRHTVD